MLSCHIVWYNDRLWCEAVSSALSVTFVLCYFPWLCFCGWHRGVCASRLKAAWWRAAGGSGGGASTSPGCWRAERAPDTSSWPTCSRYMCWSSCASLAPCNNVTLVQMFSWGLYFSIYEVNTLISDALWNTTNGTFTVLGDAPLPLVRSHLFLDYSWEMNFRFLWVSTWIQSKDVFLWLCRRSLKAWCSFTLLCLVDSTVVQADCSHSRKDRNPLI